MATMVDTVIRPMGTADIPAVWEVLRTANAQFAHQVPPRLFRAYLADVLDIESRVGRSQTLLAEHEGRTVGTITIFRDANDEGMGPAVPLGTAGIRAVAVDPAARGLGIGRRLAAAAIDQARRDGGAAIILHTWAIMEAAIRVYESVGFRRAPGYDSVSSSFFPTGIVEDPAALAFWLDL
jgi:GNAT superfamily N-acetyltransferase